MFASIFPEHISSNGSALRAALRVMGRRAVIVLELGLGAALEVGGSDGECGVWSREEGHVKLRRVPAEAQPSVRREMSEGGVSTKSPRRTIKFYLYRP